MEFQQGFSLILAVYLGLVLAGVGYNQLIGWMERRSYLEGYSSLAVAAGVLVTLGGVAIISWQAAVLALGAFAASGAPMAGGSIWRHIKAREAEQRAMREESETPQGEIL